MHKIFHKIEHIVDRLIPYILVLLLGVIIITFFFHDLAEKYHTWIEIADYAIIIVFVADLTFKFVRVRKIKTFVRKYWLDIFAVFPFYLFLRAFEELALLYRFAELGKEPQSVLHAGIEVKHLARVEKETALLIKEAEGASKLSRTGFAMRFLRPIARVPRLAKVLPYYEKTTGEHHPHDKEKSRKRRTR